MMNTIPSIERPRERCLAFGPSCLSLRECLALILGSGPPGKGCLGLASQILERSGQGMSPLDQEKAFFTAMEASGPAYLKDCTGLGPSGQARILAAFEVGRRYALHRTPTSPSPAQYNSLPDLAQNALSKITQSLRAEPQEWLGFVAMHRSGKLGDFCLVERGVRTHINFDPAEFFARLLALRPRGYFLFHNHPSGMTTPSTQDLELTRQMAAISEQFQIQFLGHWIVAPRGEKWISPL